VKTLSVAVLAAMLALGGCSSSADPAPSPTAGGSPSPIESAEGYEEPSDYTVEYSYGAFSPYAGTYRVTVRDHVAVSFEVLDPHLEGYVNAGAIALDTVLTIDDIVQLYLDASTKADEATITWDDVTGHPASVYVDTYSDAVDDEYGYTITGITVE
jgi:hypothetical protein